MKRHLLLFFILLSTTTSFSQETINTVINTLRERIHLMGYIQAGYTYDQYADPDNSFDIKRIIFMADGKITDDWSCFFMYNFNGGGTLLEAYTDYRLLPGLKARFGQFKVPYTIESPLSPTVVELIDCYSQATNYLAAIGNHDPLRGPTSGRDLGFMVFGDLFKNKLTYHLGVINGQGINTKDRNSQKDVLASLMIKPTGWLSVGGSAVVGKGSAVGSSDANPGIQAGDDYKRDRWAVGAVIDTRPVTLRTEYLGGKDGNVKSDGYYAVASFHVIPKLDLIASYDYLNKNKELSDKQTNYIAGIQYWFYPRCRLQAQYTYCDKKNGENSNLLQAQVQVRF